MILIACSSCGYALRVVGDLDEVDNTVGQHCEYWPDNYPCFNCGGKASGALETQVDSNLRARLRIRDLGPVEAIAALEGLGLPEERVICHESLEKVLEGTGLVFNGTECNGRFYVNYIKTKDSTRIYLGSSPQGAVIYRIVKPHKYMETVCASQSI